MTPGKNRRYVTVCLNGTDKNPFAHLGLKQNPFPQIAEAEYTPGCLAIQKLGGEPIPDVDYIRKVLEGFSPEFIELCCQRYEKGKLVEFQVYFDP
jgi:hypothetical protein